MICKHREELNKKYIHSLHSHMRENRDSNHYLLIKVHTPALKTRSIIDTKNTILEPISIWFDYQLRKIKHLLPTPIQESREIQRLLVANSTYPPVTKLLAAENCDVPKHKHRQRNAHHEEILRQKQE